MVLQDTNFFKGFLFLNIRVIKKRDVLVNYLLYILYNENISIKTMIIYKIYIYCFTYFDKHEKRSDLVS